MRFDREGNPIPPTREERAREWLGLAMPLLAALLLAGAGWAVLAELRTTPSTTAPAPEKSSAPDPALAMIAASISQLASQDATPQLVQVLPPTPLPTSTPDPAMLNATATAEARRAIEATHIASVKATEAALYPMCPLDLSEATPGTVCTAYPTPKPEPTSTPFPNCDHPRVKEGDRCEIGGAWWPATPTPYTSYGYPH